MPMTAYMSIEGDVQGLITEGASTHESIGNTWQQGHEDQMVVNHFGHVVNKPIDPLNGQPTGSRVHAPFRVVTNLNRGIPLCYNALVTGENLSSVTIESWRDRDGVAENFYTATMEDAVIVHVENTMPSTKDVGSQHLETQVAIHFSYRKIVWEHVISGTSGSDDWRAPVQV